MEALYFPLYLHALCSSFHKVNKLSDLLVYLKIYPAYQNQNFLFLLISSLIQF